MEAKKRGKEITPAEARDAAVSLGVPLDDLPPAAAATTAAAATAAEAAAEAGAAETVPA